MENAKKFIHGINAIDGLHVMGEPDMAVYAYTFDEDIDLNFYTYVDLLENKGGWMINRMQNPPAAHHMTSRVHMSIVEEFLADAQWAMDKIQTMPPGEEVKGEAAMYGMMGTFDDKGKIEDLVRDILLKQYSYSPRRK